MSCFSCLNCNDYNEVEQPVVMPDFIQGTVNKIIDTTNIIISYNSKHYNVKLSNITEFSKKRDVAIKALSELILNKNVTIQSMNNIQSNYMEAKVFYGGMCINNWVIYNKFANHNSITSLYK